MAAAPSKSTVKVDNLSRREDNTVTYIDTNFFREAARTGDNISVLVRSTILYVISKIFNNTDIKNYINSTTIKNSREFKKKLFNAFQ